MIKLKKYYFMMRNKLFIIILLLIISNHVFAQTNYTAIKSNGGRVDFCNQNNKIAYDRPDTNGYYNVYVTDTTGSTLINITNKPSAPQKHNGTPAWHPNGEWIVFTSQIDSVPNYLDPICGPGIGTFNNLWITDSVGSQFWQLTNYPYSYPAQGVLHPHFTHDGTKLYWSHLINNNLGLHGHWVLHMADFIVDVNGNPSLQNIQTIQPAGTSTFILYEPCGLSSSNDIIYFSSPMNNTSYWEWDIYSYDLNTNQLVNLTNSPGVWDEHSHVSPEGDKIVWSSSQGYTLDTTSHDSLKLDWWVMNLNGSGKTQISYFNTPGHPEYSVDRRGCSDLSFGKTGNQFYGLLQSEVAAFGSVVKVEFDVQPLSVDNIYDPDNIIIYPNPTNGILYISSEKDYPKLDFEIFNLIGKKVKSASNVAYLDLRNLPSGAYFLRIDLNGKLETHKIIKIE
jgi:hypothetical protein